VISIQLEDHEALVLFDFLQREIDTHKEKRLAPLFEHPAEFWALNNVLVRLESLTSAPLRPDYEAAVGAGRAQIMFECDPEGTFPIGAHE
jgi:hypothetical protein